MALVKICGLTTADTLDAALMAGVDMVGFVFHPRSPRRIEPAAAAELAARARGRARIVALVVDRDDDFLTSLVGTLAPDMLQLHGSETTARVTAVKALTGLPVMKAVGIASAADVASLGAWRGIADRLLVDAKPPKDAAYPGGHGRPFDWSLVAGLDPALSPMLSGGLDAANVGAAIRLVRPAGVDVSSGVESAPGVKDVQKIGEFVAAARRAFRELAR